MRRDVLPEDAKTLADNVNEALLAGNEPKANHFVRVFQDKAAKAIAETLAASENDDKTRRRVLAQIGTPRAAEDAATLKRVLAGRDALEGLAAHLPLRISNLADDTLDKYKALIEKTSAATASFSSTRCLW